MIHEPAEGGRGEAAHVGAGELQGGGGHHHPGDRGHGGAVDSDQGRHRGIWRQILQIIIIIVIIIFFKYYYYYHYLTWNITRVTDYPGYSRFTFICDETLNVWLSSNIILRWEHGTNIGKINQGVQFKYTERSVNSCTLMRTTLGSHADACFWEVFAPVLPRTDSSSCPRVSGGVSPSEESPAWSCHRQEKHDPVMGLNSYFCLTEIQK